MQRGMADMMKRMGKGTRSPFGGIDPRLLSQLGAMPPGLKK
jgi:hypothetical protein